MVVDDRRVVLGFLPAAGARDATSRAEQAMAGAPDTVRPSASPQEMLEYMGEGGEASDHILVTTSDGELVGLALRRDVEQCLGEGRAAGTAERRCRASEAA